jgi:uncharacterized protein YkwD
MKGRRSRLLANVAAVFLAIALLSGPVSAQAGLGTRLDEAGKKLDSDQQSCRPINLAEYALLLQEASKNKKLAQKAAKAGAPPNPQVDAELGKAMMLFARAQAAQAMQCMQAAQAQPQAQVTHEQLEQLPVGHRPEDLVASCPPDTFPTITRSPAAVVGGVTAPATVSLTCAAPADAAMIEVYRTHNRVRSEYGAPPLVRDPALELGAGEYVGELVRVGRPVHSSRAGRGNIRENISQGMSWWSPAQLMQTWLRERANFVPGTFPNVSRTHNWYDVGHWAQILWVRSVLIGCARAAGISASFMVCRYGPGGNRDGEQVGIPPRQYSVEAPTLPTAEVFTQLARPTATTAPSQDDMTIRTASLFDLGIYAGGVWTTDWFEIGESDNMDFGDALTPQLLCIVGGPKGATEPAPLYPDGPDGSAIKWHGFGQETNVEMPELPTKEVYNPADLPKCPLEIM